MVKMVRERVCNPRRSAPFVTIHSALIERSAGRGIGRGEANHQSRRVRRSLKCRIRWRYLKSPLLQFRLGREMASLLQRAFSGY